MGLFSIRGIVSNHIKIVRENSTDSYAGFLFIGVPLIAAGVLSTVGINIDIEFLGLLISALSILIGFSINAVVLISRVSGSDETRRMKQLVRQTRIHTLYILLIGVGFLIIVLITHLTLSNIHPLREPPYIGVISGLIYLVGSHYTLSLLLVPARIYVILEK